MRANIKQIMNELNSLLRNRFSDDLKEVVLFGSRAYGTSHNDSDYDILIVLKNKPDWKKEREISDLCYEIDLKFNIITDTHIISEGEFSSLRGKQPIFLNAMEKGFRS
ncbi:MAG: nucleotidyltransferase domain-containing protein [Bacteroidales bacterium]|nr:nucleotidyltransferase domain-containing protein [Bacteroidales bacterium]